MTNPGTAGHFHLQPGNTLRPGYKIYQAHKTQSLDTLSDRDKYLGKKKKKEKRYLKQMICTVGRTHNKISPWKPTGHSILYTTTSNTLVCRSLRDSQTFACLYVYRDRKLSLKQWSRQINKYSQSILSIWRNNHQTLLIIFPLTLNKAMHVIWTKVKGGGVQSSSPCFLSLSLCKQGWVIRQGWWGALEMWMGESENNELRYPSTHISSQFLKSESAWAQPEFIFLFLRRTQCKTKCSGLRLMNY